MTLYIFKNNQQLGPFDESHVRNEMRSGNFSASDLACQEGSTQWVPLSTLFPAETYGQESNSQSSYPGMNQQQASQGPGTQQQPPPSGSYYQQPPQQPPQPLIYQPVVVNPYAAPSQPSGSSLPVMGMSMGIVVLSLMLVGLVPCLGWMNWFVLPLAGVTNILCWVSIFTEKDLTARNKALIGLVLSFVAIFIGGIRLILGGGCL
jgi:hypothetical protein